MLHVGLRKNLILICEQCGDFARSCIGRTSAKPHDIYILVSQQLSNTQLKSTYVFHSPITKQLYNRSHLPECHSKC